MIGIDGPSLVVVVGLLLLVPVTCAVAVVFLVMMHGEEDAAPCLLEDAIFVKAFCRRAVLNFFENDLLSAVWRFFLHAEGTFGISVTCSLWPNKAGLH